MSAPSHRIRQAEHISYGFLAVNSIEALERLLGGDAMRDTDTKALQKASEFITDIADGAELVTKGSYPGHNSTASMKALDVAIGPLEQLQDLAQDKKVVAEKLRSIASKLDSIIERGGKMPDNDQAFFESLIRFFQSVNKSLMREMTRNRQKIPSTKNFVGRHRLAMGH